MAVPLSRAAATSSAVPIVLSPVTLNNYGGTCGFKFPAWLAPPPIPNNPARPAARALKRMEEMESFANGKDRPFLHLVDGGLADNLGMRAVLEVLEEFEALRDARDQDAARRRQADRRRRRQFAVGARRTRGTSRSAPPGTFEILLKATGVPIDRYSSETVELLRDMIARWDLMRRIRDVRRARHLQGSVARRGHLHGPDTRLYAIDVSFPQLKDPAEFAYLNDLPTSFVLTPEAVDRLRAAAGTILLDSPDFQRLLKDIGAKVVTDPANPTPATKAVAPK